MRTGVLLASLVALVLALVPNALAPGTAEADSQGIESGRASGASVASMYYRAEAAWNDRDERAAIAAESKQKVGLGTDTPDAYLAWSLVALADGHTGGDRFRQANYLRGSVRAATGLANLALKRNSNVALAHLHRAFLHLVAGSPDAAQRELELADALAKPGFHARLYAAVIQDERGRLDRADALLVEAERAATHPHHYTIVNRARVRVAQSGGNRDLEEQLHLENIEMNPASAYAHGSYADFLLRARRNQEAINRYEQAAALERYPAVVRGLDKARLRLRLSRSKATRPMIERGLASEPPGN